MKFKKTAPLFIASSLVLLAGCGASIDGDTESSYKSSLKKITKNMTTKEASALKEAANFIAQQSSKRERRSDLDGEDADGIIDLADTYANTLVDKELELSKQTYQDLVAYGKKKKDVSFSITPSERNGEGCFDIAIDNKTPYRLTKVSFSARINAFNGKGEETSFAVKQGLMAAMNAPLIGGQVTPAYSGEGCALGLKGLDETMGMHGFYLTEASVFTDVVFDIDVKMDEIMTTDNPKLGYKTVKKETYKQIMADIQYDIDHYASMQGLGYFKARDVKKPKRTIVANEKAIEKAPAPVDPNYTVPSKAELHENWGLFNTAQWTCEMTGNKTPGCDRIADAASYHVTIDAAVFEILGAYKGYVKCGGIRNYRGCTYVGKYNWRQKDPVIAKNHFGKGAVGVPKQLSDTKHEFSLLYGIKTVGDRRIIKSRLLSSGNPNLDMVEVVSNKNDLKLVDARTALLIRFNK